jgi:tRNA (mo5U34)-methyltransferase
VNEAELRERVASFRQWHYEFDLDGVRTPIFDRTHVNRHEQRKRYFFSPLVRLCGGSLAGKRVLDLGCNAGFWSLAAMEAGADFVLGIDARQMHIDQAKLVFEAKRINRDRYRFEVANIFDVDLASERPFDVALCLGLLYHVAKPFELIERISGWNTDLLVIDTKVDPASDPVFRVLQQFPHDPRSAANSYVALLPSRTAVCSLVREYGYRLVTLRPSFTNWEGSGGYRRGIRRAFLCAKRTPLVDLDTEPLGGAGAVTWNDVRSAAERDQARQIPLRGHGRKLRRKVRAVVAGWLGRSRPF